MTRTIPPLLGRMALVLGLIACSEAQRDDRAMAPASVMGIEVRHAVPTQLQGPERRFAIEPYLTQLEPTAAVVSWRLSAPRATTFGLAEAGGEAEIETEPDESDPRQVRVRLTGLVPGRTYRYVVDGAFRAAFETPVPGADFKCVVVGHTHGTEHFEHYPDVLLAGQVRNLRPDFLVHTGDMTYHATPREFGRHFFSLFGEVIRRVPVYASPGNHDSGWPFVYGPRLRVFRQLFAYPFPDQLESPDREAHYTILRSGVRFYFLSYSTGIGPESNQRRWLAQALKASKAEFNIAVYGGAQKLMYKEGELVQALSQAGIDLILNGDGSAPKQTIRHSRGIPIIELGTGGSKPHPLAILDKQDHCIRIRIQDAAGAPRQSYWVYSRRLYQPKLDLLPLQPKVIRSGGQLKLDYHFSPHLDSAKLHGVQFEVGNKSFRDGRFVAYVVPELPKPGGHGEGGFRSQYHRFNGLDRVVTMRMPMQNPFDDDKPFKISKIRFVFLNIAALQDLELKSFYLY